MLDINNWKEFKLLTIVPDINNAKAYNNSDLNDSYTDDYLYYITRTDSKNGISRFVNDDNLEGKEEGNAITIGDTTATIYYQDKPFVAGPHIIVLRAPWFNKYTALFLITVLNLEKDKYPVFGRAFTKDLIKNTIVKLPVDNMGNPDYAFMEEYIKSLKIDINNIPDYFLDEGYDKACWYLDNIDQEKFEREYANNKIDEKFNLQDIKWDYFKVGDIFYIKNGCGITNAEVEEHPGMFEVVQGGSKLNGVFGNIDIEYCKEKGYVYYEKKCLAVARVGTSGFVSFHNNGCVVGDKAKLLISKRDLSNHIHMFLVTILNQLKEKYGYGARGVVKEIYENELILLPVDKNQNPDWEFMDNYIKSLPYSFKI